MLAGVGDYSRTELESGLPDPDQVFIKTFFFAPSSTVSARPNPCSNNQTESPESHPRCSAKRRVDGRFFRLLDTEFQNPA